MIECNMTFHGYERETSDAERCANTNACGKRDRIGRTTTTAKYISATYIDFDLFLTTVLLNQEDIETVSPLGAIRYLRIVT